MLTVISEEMSTRHSLKRYRIAKDGKEIGIIETTYEGLYEVYTYNSEGNTNRMYSISCTRTLFGAKRKLETALSEGCFYSLEPKKPDSMKHKIYKKIIGRLLRNLAKKTHDISMLETIGCAECFSSWQFSRNRIEIDTCEETAAGEKITRVCDSFDTYIPLREYDIILLRCDRAEDMSNYVNKAKCAMKRNGAGILCLIMPVEVFLRAQLTHPINDLELQVVNSACFGDYIGIRYRVRKHDQESIFIRMARDALRGGPQGKGRVESLLTQYVYEAAAGCEFIRQYESILPIFGNSNIIQLETSYNGNSMINAFVEGLRIKYWRLLFKCAEEIIPSCGSSMYYSFGSGQEFNLYSIEKILGTIDEWYREVCRQEIFDLYDQFTEENSFYGSELPMKTYTGIDGTLCSAIGKFAIISCNDGVYSGTRYSELSCSGRQTLITIEKAMNMLLSENEESVKTEFGTTYRWIESPYFTASFYKKGYGRITFKNTPVITRINIFVGIRRGYLFADYGRIPYEDLNEEQRRVVDSFQGQRDYGKVTKKPDFYLIEPGVKSLRELIESSEEQ